MNIAARPGEELLRALHASAADIGRSIAFMEVCGTHTTSAFRCGLHSVMPKNVRLISGPGCPVCVTAQADIDQLIDLGSRREITLCTYGDMLRVPGKHGSLEKARGDGANIEVVYSSLDAVRMAQTHSDRQVVFAAVGFETTAPATAAAICAAQELGLDNFTVLASHKLILPAMRALLSAADRPKIDGFLCPGHVSVIIGSDAYRCIADEFNTPCVIGGFEPGLLLSSLLCLTEMIAAGRVALVNQYPQAVRPTGNAHAQALLQKVFETGNARWRGLGLIPQSGLFLRQGYARFNAAQRFSLKPVEDREPAGCICGRVISGLAMPPECKLFGRACTPVQPIGPCMVSSEGTCAAWFKYGPHRAESHGVAPAQQLQEVLP